MAQRLIGWVLLAVAFTPYAWAQDAGAPQVQIAAVLNKQALQPGQPAVVAVVLDIREGLHIQSSKPLEKGYVPLVVKLDPAAGISPGPVQYAPGEIHEYPFVGKLSVYSGRTVAYVPLTVESDASLGDVKLTGKVRYQACDDQGTCMMPVDATFELATTIVPAGQAVGPNRPELFAGFAAGPATQPDEPARDEGDVIERFFRNSSLPVILLVGFGIGIIFNLMPCVLPVLPLKIISFYETAQHSRGRSFLLSIFFGGGIVFTFGILAMLVLVLKVLPWGGLFAKAWFVWPMALILTLLGLSLIFGYALRLPSAIYNITPQHETYSGNFVLGILAAILSTPCTAPVFPGLLKWAASQPDVLGVAAMLMVGVGMAAPYVLLSAFPEVARRFPRMGPVSEIIKQLMGFLLIAAAAYFAGGRLIVGANFWWIVFAVIVIAGIYLVLRTARLMPRPRPIVIALVVALLMIGPSLWFVTGATGLRSGGVEGELPWREYSADALRQAREAKRIVLVDFTASWCGNCQYLESTVFRSTRAREAFKKYDVVLLRADVTTDTAPGNALLTQLSSTGGIPLTAIYAPGRDTPIVIPSVYTTQTLIDRLEMAASGK